MPETYQLEVSQSFELFFLLLPASKSALAVKGKELQKRLFSSKSEKRGGSVDFLFDLVLLFVWVWYFVFTHNKKIILCLLN